MCSDIRGNLTIPLPSGASSKKRPSVNNLFQTFEILGLINLFCEYKQP